MSIGSVFKQGFDIGCKPFFPAFKLLLTTMLLPTIIMLLGAGLIIVDHGDGGLHQSILSLFGEGLMLAGGLIAVAVTVLVWRQMFISAGFIRQNHEG
jgi:hypothetical protein